MMLDLNPMAIPARLAHQKLTGFTLIELMVTLAVAGILLMFAVPSFQDATLGSKLTSYANTFIASSNMARSEAFKRNAAIKLCVSTDGLGCDSGGWEQGWIIFRDADNDNDVDSSEILIHRQQAFPSGIKLTGSTNIVLLQPTGVGATQLTLTVCRASPSVGKQERVVSLTTTGRASVAQTQTGVCS